MFGRHFHDVDVVIALQFDTVGQAVEGHFVRVVWKQPRAPSIAWVEAEEVKFQADRTDFPVRLRAVVRVLERALVRHAARADCH